MFGRDKRNGKTDLSKGSGWGRGTDRRHGSGCRDVVGRGGHGGKEGGKICECLVLGGVEGGERRRRGRILEGMDQVVGGGQGAVGGRCGRHGNAGREPGKGVSNAFGTCFGDPDAVATVMVQGGAKVPTFDSMGGPSFADGRLDMDKDASTGRSKRGAVVVESTMKLGVGGQLGIDAGATKKIEGDKGLWEEAVPKMQGKIRVSGAEASNKVVLEGADGPFGCITTV
jgi:hypothetical protein